MDEVSDLLEGFKSELNAFEHDLDKIDFLEKYLRTHSGISLDLLAFIYESLGDLRLRSGRPSGSFFQKAASTWEMIGVLRKGEKDISVSKRECLKNSVKNYKRAFKAYERSNSISDLEETRDKLKEARNELRKHGGPGRTISIQLVMVAFLASFFLLSPQLTGFVAEGNTGTFSIAGFVLVLLGVLGVFFVLKRWY